MGLRFQEIPVLEFREIGGGREGGGAKSTTVAGKKDLQMILISECGMCCYLMLEYSTTATGDVWVRWALPFTSTENSKAYGEVWCALQYQDTGTLFRNEDFLLV